MKKVFRPEILNRIDGTIVIHSLEKKHMKDNVELMLIDSKERLAGLDIDFSITDKTIEKIAKEGFDPEYGARPLRRAIQKHVEDIQSEELLKETISKDEKVNIGLRT